ncbi:hypothetical protein I309_06213 [Cryptococcus deuterogattii LA55]|nr:hypothetical protein I309_06213 [Cryptococcus deuterogattii LA55]KIR95486.1 hypothetical protein I304_00237 [Cryptococcus deuterogattii CBS 10090]
MPGKKPELSEPPCKLFAITQYQCSPESGRVACWPLERIFRQQMWGEQTSYRSYEPYPPRPIWQQQKRNGR